MMAVSSALRLKNAKQAVKDSGTTVYSFANKSVDRIMPAQMIQKSRTFQNHSFTVARRFSG